MKKAIEFFYKGPGAIILIAAAVISLGVWMHQKQDRKEAEEAKQETKRDLGTINPKTATDPGCCAAGSETGQARARAGVSE